MLKSLHVKNLALIEEADIDFSDGFTVFSGETGAGKSILLESIHLALGGRSSKDLIRTGKEFALAELTFVPESKELLESLSEMGIWPEDGEIRISRKITADKSILRINGETVGSSYAREAGELLLDIHGQNEHQSLLKKSKAIQILDEYGKNVISKIKDEYVEIYKEYKDIEKKLENKSMDENTRLRELDFVNYEINEIEAANLQPDEEDELAARLNILSNGRSIIQALSQAHDYISMNSGATDSIGYAVKEVSGVAGFDSELNKIYEQLSLLEDEAGECARAISGYLDNFNFDEQELEETTQRLDLIRDLEKKYGRNYNDIMAYLKKSIEKRDELLSMEENRVLLETKLKANQNKLKTLSDKLTDARKISAKELEVAIIDNLQELNFLQVNFSIDISSRVDFSEDGKDKIEFLISMNKGENLKPLENVASGGELSRIMLALKTVLANADPIETQIFDEIDAGISGITASCVAKKLRQIGRRRQVFCISHLPQIVASADNHLLIEKHIEDDKTVTTVTSLDEKGSINELARILGGDQITDKTIDAAKELKSASCL